MTGVQWFYVSGVAIFLVTVYVAGLRAAKAERSTKTVKTRPKAPPSTAATNPCVTADASLPRPQRKAAGFSIAVQNRASTIIAAHSKAFDRIPSLPPVSATPVGQLFDPRLLAAMMDESAFAPRRSSKPPAS